MNISFNKREVKYVPSLPHVIESGFIPNRAVEVRQLAKGKGKGKYFACRKEKGLFKGYNPQTCSKLFKDFEDAVIAAKKML